MSTLIVRIQWDWAIEYVQVNADLPLSIGDQIQTVEYRPDTSKHLSYTAECIDYRREDSAITIRLRYEFERNIHLADEDVAWGDSQLSIDLLKCTAQAEWVDSGMHPELNKVCKCTVLNEELIGELSREVISRIARPEQTRLRSLLIDTYGACAISSETTHAALEAAHIVDVQFGGGYGLNNALLLRADLHRLFDAGLLTITPSGEIFFHESVSTGYRDERFRRFLPSPIKDLVMPALTTRLEAGLKARQ